VAAAPLRLVAIDEHNWRDALAVGVHADQLPFVAGHQPVALVVLAKAYVRPGGLEWEPLAVVRGDRVVGVLALAHDAARSELLHLAIDEPHQGQGLGRAAVELAVGHVRATRPGCRELRLSVHPDNARAQRLYRTAGFGPTGEERDGEPVWSLDLAGGSAVRSTTPAIR
jgi:diamine N-acetyltransferase